MKHFLQNPTLIIAVTFSVIAHAALLAVTFSAPKSQRAKPAESTLDVILVNSKHDKKPLKAEALAQADLDGGGTADKGRASSPLPNMGKVEDGDSLLEKKQRAEEAEEEEELKLTALYQTVKRSTFSVPPMADRSTPTESVPDTGDKAESAKAIARQEAEILKRISDENKRPRKTFISPSTAKVGYAEYYDNVRQQVEKLGTYQFPQKNGKKLYGELIISISIYQDGTLYKGEGQDGVKIEQTSGVAGLDSAAVRIVRQSAPFGNFPKSMRSTDKTDVWVAVFTFKFTREDALEAEMRGERQLTLIPDRYAVIGNPVAHSKSPAIHAQFAAQTGQVLTYERLLAPLDDFAGTLRAFCRSRGRGANVTVPFKLEAHALSHGLSERAQVAGAVNTLRFDAKTIFGDNTDGVGLVADIVRNAGVAIRDRRILLLGAGGAARGVVLPLLSEKPDQLVIANRTQLKAEELVERFREQGRPIQACSFDALQGSFDIIINATSASLAAEVPSVPSTVFKADTLAYDMMYGSTPTAFVKFAMQHGAAGRDGLGMLIEQAAESFFVWRGVRPETAPALANLRTSL